MLVSVAQGLGYFASNPERILHRKLPLALQPSSKGLALHIGHRVIQQPVSLTGVVEAQDVRVIQARRDVNLAEEALGPEHGTELRVQHLEGHRPIMSEVVGEVHGGHAAAAELALEHVPPFEGGLQTGRQ
jgi:hypothetical protein